MRRKRPRRSWIVLVLGLGLLALAPALTRAQPAPPLNIAADNVSGSHGPEGDVVLLNGHVRITRAQTVITAERGRYLRAQGMLYLDDHVRLVDTTTVLTCDHASYSETTDRLDVNGNVVIVDRDVTLRAPGATYDRRTGRADLFGGVQGQDRNQHLNADNASYLRDSLLLKARGHVRGVDPENKLELRADSIDYDRRTHDALARGNPVLESRDDQGRVAVIRAITLKVNTDTRIAQALDSVRVTRDTLQARSDYALFDDKADRGWLLGHPRAWDNETVVTGDTLEIWTEKRALRRFVVRRDAVIDYHGARPNTIGEASRLTGRVVNVFFTGDDIDSLVAVGEARNRYQSVPRPGKTNEVNLAQGDSITVFFKDRKIDRAVVQGTASGEYHFPVAVGDTTAIANEIVKYDGRRIEYIVPKNRIVLETQSHLVYRELELTARKVEFDSEKQTLVANGDPQLVDRGDKVVGHLMTYDLESRTGTIYQAATTYEKGLYHGARIRKVGENILDVMDGSYSTCNLEEPHYHFQAHWMKIYLKDKLVAKPVVFYVKNVPLLALPFYIFPIKPGRHSGFLFPQFEFGLNNRAGQFLRNAGYYWAPNDYMDATVAGDYYQAEPSWKITGESRYALLYKVTGNLSGSFARNERDNTRRWDFSADHSQDLTTRTQLIARAQFVSSRDYRRDLFFGTPLSERLDRFLTSSFSITHNADWAALAMFVDRRQDLDADESLKDPDGTGPLQGKPLGTVASQANLTSSAPSVSVSFPTRTIGSLGLLRNTPLQKALAAMYVSMNARFLSQYTRTAFVSGFSRFNRDSVTVDSSSVIGQRIETRRAAAGSASLRDSRRLFGWLNFSPAINTNGVVFDHDELGHDVVPTGTWNASLTTSSTFYGTFAPHLGSLVGIRHVVFPSLSIAYSPKFENLTFVDTAGVRRNRFDGFGGIGVSGFEQASLNFGLDQRLQVKLRKGDNVQRLDNLLQWTTGGSYNFLYREQGLRHPLSSINSAMRLSPPRYVNADLTWLTDVYASRPLRSLAYNVALNLNAPAARTGSVAADLPLEQRAAGDVDFTEPWTLSFAYSYAGGYQSTALSWKSQQTANAVLHTGLTPSWRLDYSLSYDVTQKELLTQRFGLTRDLHCWQASFTRTFNFGSEAEYYFRLGIKDQKEIYIDRGTRTGSFGGIQ